MKILKAVALAAVLVLAACATPVSNQIGASEGVLTTVNGSIVEYAARPRCGTGSVPICSTAVMVHKLALGAKSASDALIAADAAQTPEAYNAAMVAVAAVQSLLATIPAAIAVPPATK